MNDIYWNKNNSHIRNDESVFKQEIKSMDLMTIPQSGVLFNNSRIHNPITPGNIRMGNSIIKPDNDNKYSSTFTKNISYTKPMPLSKSTLSYSTY